MSKRLLKEAEALKKIELSLKLQGKTFEPKNFDCEHCKFCWGNVPGGKPRWNRIYGWPNSGHPTPEKPENPKPEKYGWHCEKYVGAPYHAFLRFLVHQTDKVGNPIRYNKYSYPDPFPGITTTFTLVTSGKVYHHKICRRFESSGRK